MSAKELGQIHTINRNFQIGYNQPAGDLAVGDIDIPGELTSQLQRMVRAGNMFKIVGIDMTLDLKQVPNRDVTVSGYLRYFAPTRGRCAAFRSAFKAMAEQMNNQGISMRSNELYDFRCPINSEKDSEFKNQATLDGTNGLCLTNPGVPTASVFGVHNSSVRPTYTDTDSNLYSEGFSTLLAAASTDFVLNDTVPYTGNHHEASESYETIPFQIKFTNDNTSSATATFQWRPDPALYLAVMCGQFQVVINNAEDTSTLPDPLSTLNFSVMVSGWKSIMGNPEKKKKSRRSRKK